VYRFHTIYTIISLFLLSSLTWANGFEKNGGQVHDASGRSRADVRFVYQGNGVTVILRNNGFSYQIMEPKDANDPRPDGAVALNYHRIDIDFEGMNPEMGISTSTASYRNVHYGENDSEHSTTVHDEVMYTNVFDGVDFQFISDSSGFKYNIICRNATALNHVRLRYSGMDGSPTLVDKGLALSTRFGVIEERIPVSYRCSGAKCETCEVIPILSGDLIGFWLPELTDTSEIIIIDPLPHLLWSTYAGGNSIDEVQQVEVDEMGNVFISGFTTSVSNIATSGAHQGTLVGFQNCFLMKFSPTGQKLFGTYFGGQQADRCYGMVRNPSTGHIYLSGSTFSQGIATTNAHQVTLASPDDGLLVKFDASGQLIWSTYFGGNDHDFIASMVLDPQGDILMTGHTRSVYGISTDGTVLPGFENAFVAKFDASGYQIWGTYYGGSYDEGWGIGLDAQGNIYVSGETSSVSGISTIGTHQQSLGGGLDAFLAKFNGSGQLQWGTYFGGAGGDRSKALTVASDGAIFIIGNTESSTNIATQGAHQTQMGSIDDAFLAKFNPNGSRQWATYIGGGGVEYLYAMKQTNDNGLLIAGQSESTDNVTTSNAFQPLPAGEYDALLMRFSSGGQFEWGTYLGGPGSDYANDLAIDSTTGHIVIAGMTRSTSMVATPNAQNSTYLGGLYDGFVAKLCVPPAPEIHALDGQVICGDGELAFTIEDDDLQFIQWNLGGNLPTYHFEAQTVGAYSLFADVMDVFGCPGQTDTVDISVFEAVQLPISIIAHPDSIACVGAEIILSVQPPYSSQLWMDGSTDLTFSYPVNGTEPIYVEVTVFNADGCSDSDSILVQGEICMGMEEADEALFMRIYPNPSSGNFWLEWDEQLAEQLQVVITSSDGREVFRDAVKRNDPLSLTLPNGMYLLTATDGYLMQQLPLVIIAR